MRWPTSYADMEKPFSAATRQCRKCATLLPPWHRAEPQKWEDMCRCVPNVERYVSATTVAATVIVPSVGTGKVSSGYRRIFYGCMFHAAWETLDKFFGSKGLKGGMTSILHTWGSNMSYHPHLHCIVPGGGLDTDGKWHTLTGCKDARQYLFPVQALSSVFRAKMMALLTKCLAKENITILQNIRKKAFGKGWVVYSRPPAKGVNQVLEYIGRYAYRVAISNSRIKEISPEGMVTYDYKDYRHNGVHKQMTLTAVDFLHLFSMHILPSAFVRIRHYGILAPCNRDKIRSIQEQLNCERILPEHREKKSWMQICQEQGWNTGKCPCCGCDMLTVEIIPPRSPPHRENATTLTLQ